MRRSRSAGKVRYKWFFLHFAGSAVMIEFGGLSEGELNQELKNGAKLGAYDK
ncbi:hypothetical protein [Bacillus sp. 7705b]|uniref:hypothetical protein n=1 Tax=Bacillus sp. 7705b TaxID=2028568 RepID=UPI001595F865|nr:hypothetical protein [Bacillus sp. 7705b]